MWSLWRIFKFTLQDAGRNPGLTFMTVFMLTLMLLSLNALWAVEVVTTEAVRLVKGQVEMSLYLSATASEEEVAALVTRLKSFSEVTSVEVNSREQVLRSFEERYAKKTEVIAALRELGNNPFGPTLTITVREPEQFKTIIQAVTVSEYERLIESKSFEEHEDAIERLQRITNRIEQVGFALALFFAVIAFLIIFNTIRVAIVTQRIEIGIKRLVGASSWFIRGPYLVGAVFFTLVSVGLTIGLVFLGLRYADPYLTVVFPNQFSLTSYFRLHMLYLFGVQTIVVLALTIISSTLAMRRQLKV